MSVVPEQLHAPLLGLLQGLSSSDNSIRSEAEKVLEQEWSSTQNTELLLTFLAEQACSSGDESSQAFAAVLFRRIAIKTPKNITNMTDRTIGIISEDGKQQIRSIFLQGFTLPQSNQVRHKLSDAISELAKEDVSPHGSWSELVPALFAAAQNPDPSFRESAFRVFTTTPALLDKSYIENVVPIFNSGFEDSSDSVKISACTAFVSFFRELPKSYWPQLQSLIPNLLNSLPRFLQNGQDEALSSVLEALIDLVELAPKMFKDMFLTIIDFCAMVCKNKDLDSSTRMASLELLTTFAEVSPSMCKRSSNFAETIIIITLSMMTEVCIDDDDAADWNNDDDLDEDDAEPEYDAARQALDRVSLKLNGQSLVSHLFQYLPAMLQSNVWRERQAALMALSSAAEGCADVLADQVPSILDMILPTLQDDHPRVQYACANALGQMSSDFEDLIQRTAGERVLPALISKLTNKSVPRVQAHVAAALVNFSEAASKEVLEPFLDDLLNNLVGLLNSPKRYVQEQVLTTIAIIADAAEKKFIKYYDTLMPMLTDVLKTDFGTENRTLKARCIECTTLIALAVGKEQFAPHCQDLITLFGSLQESIMGEDDPVKQYLEQGWGRICRIIGKDFLPFLPIVLPPLLEQAKAAQDISLLEEEEAEEFISNEEWDVINISGKMIAVHTAALDVKVQAMDLLRIYAIQLKGDFFPWVKEIIQTIGIPALDFYLHDGVRGSAALTLASLLRCSVYATGNNSNETLGFWTQISGKLVEILTNEPVPELLVAYYTALVDCIGALGPNSLSATQLSSWAKSINANLTEIYQRVKERENDEDEYTEDVEEDEEEYTDEELLDEINRAITAIFISSKSNFLQAFESLGQTIQLFINDENTNIKFCGLTIVRDILQHCGTDSAVFKDVFLNVLGESISSANASIRQVAAESIGVAASSGGDVYREFCIACLEPMFKMASVPDNRAEENIYATENFVVAISKVCHAFGNYIQNLEAIITQWITLMPIIQDEIQAPHAYNFLTELIKSQHPGVTNQVPKVIEVIILALCHGSIGGQLAENAVLGAKQLLGQLPQAEAVSILEKNPDEFEIVRKLFS